LKERGKIHSTAEGPKTRQPKSNQCSWPANSTYIRRPGQKTKGGTQNKGKQGQEHLSKFALHIVIVIVLKRRVLNRRIFETLYKHHEDYRCRRYRPCCRLCLRLRPFFSAQQGEIDFCPFVCLFDGRFFFCFPLVVDGATVHPLALIFKDVSESKYASASQLLAAKQAGICETAETRADISLLRTTLTSFSRLFSRDIIRLFRM